MASVDINKSYSRLLVLWFALVVSIGLYLVVGLVTVKESISQLQGSNRSLALGLTIVAFSLVIASIALRRMLLRRSVDQQNQALVQSATIIGCAFCEAAAMMGLLLRFISHFDKFYLFFVLAIVGMMLHFPRRSDLINASFKQTGDSSL